MLRDGGERLEVVAHAGATDDTMAVVKTLLREPLDASACRFTVRALREGRSVVCNDVAADPAASVWRDAALERGYRSMVALPLAVSGAVVGVLNLYADEAEFFDSDELRLLNGLGNDIGFALEVNERRSAQRRAEDTLRASEERLRELADTIDQVFYVEEPSGPRVLYVSPAYERVWGRTCASLYAAPKSWREAVHPEDRGKLRSVVDTPPGDRGLDEVYRIIRPDGSVRWIHDRSFAVRDEEARVLRIVGAAEDITERVALEEQVRQSQKMETVGRLAGGVAHDFNNLLTVIQGYGSLLQMPEPDANDVKHAAAEIVRASGRAAELTRQLLAFSKRQVMLPRLLDLNTVVTGLDKMVGRVLREDVRLELKLHPRPLLTRADPGMLDQVLLNLVMNARDAMPDGGAVLIETTEGPAIASAPGAGPAPGSSVCLRVTDSGIGIPAEDQGRIFEPFYTTKVLGEGTGLGLATVFGIVVQHGGTIEVFSEVGRGSTFEVVLPATEVTRAPEPIPITPVSTRRGTEAILLVEDDEAVRRLSATVLRRAGYAVIEAATGAEALKLWDQSEGTISLVLTDIVMPGGMSGRELATRLHARDKRLRIIYTSGYSSEIAGKELFLLDGENFLRKPTHPDRLLDVIRRCLDA